MKTLKSMLSLILVIAMLLTSVVVFADEVAADTTTAVAQESTSDMVKEFPDVAKTEKYYDAVQILNKLDIIKGYEDGTFGPMKNVTRAEFATMIIRFLGMSGAVDNSKENLPFPDIDGVDWAIGNIRTAKSLGIINGYEDGTFRPNNNVSFEEAVKMVVCTLGYENYSQPGTNWFDKYITSATKLGILKNASGAISVPATRSCISQILYNSLEVDLMENNKITEVTPLESYLRIQKYTGVITSNGVTSTTDSYIDLADNTIMIDETEFRVDNIAEYKGLLGAKVTVYYKENRKTEVNEVISLKILSGEAVKVDLRDIESYDEEKITYYVDDKEKTVKLEEANVVIYNGRLYNETEEDSYFTEDIIDDAPVVGTLEFVDTNKNGAIDVIYFDAYEMFYVSVASSGNYTVTDNLTPYENSADKTRILDSEAGPSEEYYFYDESGKETTFESIKKGNVLAIRTTNDNEVCNVTILTKSVSGTVSSLKSGKNATIGGTKYNFSKAAPWFSDNEDVVDKMPEPSKDAEGKYYLDINGDIFLYEAVKHTYQYGYLIKVARDERKDSNGKTKEFMQAKVLTTSGSQEIIDFSNKTKIDGWQVGTDFEEAEDVLYESAKNSAKTYPDDVMGEKQVIKYSTTTKNGAKTFTEIITATEADTKPKKLEEGTLARYTGLDGAEATYTSSQLKANGNSASTSGAKVFVVPTVDKISNSKNFKVGSTSMLKSTGNIVEVFDVSSTAAKIVVIYGASAAQPVKYNTAVCRVLEEAYEDYDTNGDSHWYIKVYDHMNKKEQNPYIISEESVELAQNLKEGDLVRFGKDEDGHMKIDEEYVLYSYQDAGNMNQNMANDTDTDKDGFFYYVDDNSNGDKFTYKYLNGVKEYDEDYTPGEGTGDPYYGRKELNSEISMKLIHGWVYDIPDFADEEVSGNLYITVKDVEDNEEIKGNGYTVDAPYTSFSGCKFYEYTTVGNDNFKCTELTGDYKDIISTFTTYVDFEENATEVIAYLNGSTVKALFIIK